METSEKIDQLDTKNKVHEVLAHSYLFYFVSFLVGLFWDFVFPVKIFDEFNGISFGVLFLIIGTILILWAQKASFNFKKDNITKSTFSHGPYRYTRSPTHYGLFLLMLGFGIMSNSLFIIIFSIISFAITKLVFIKKEEKILARKYGTPYLEYKDSVKF